MNSPGYITNISDDAKTKNFLLHQHNIGFSGDSVKVWAGRAQKKAEEEEVPFCSQCCAPEP